jgi:hypothetical protein
MFSYALDVTIPTDYYPSKNERNFIISGELDKQITPGFKPERRLS